MVSIDGILLGTALLLLTGVLASKISDRLGVPALLLFIAIGILAGSEGIGGIHFDDPKIAQSLGIVALAYILFAGGFDTRWRSVRPVVGQALSLATLGVLLTALTLGAAASVLFGFGWVEGMLLGAIVSSTDAAAVFAVLRSRGANLKGNLRPLLELESGSNDPMAVFLTIGLLGLLQDQGAPPLSLVGPFFLQMGVGAALGLALGRLSVRLVNRIQLGYEGLYPVLTLGLVLLIYALTATLGGSGFLAVYLAGMVMGNSRLIHRQSLVRFHDGLAWLMQIAMFLALGLLVFPSRLLPTAGMGALLSLFLIFVARPVGVFMALAASKASPREKLMVSWVGLRGSVPIILATFPLVAGLQAADAIFNIVFFIVLLSVTVQGPSLAWVARRLGLAAPMDVRRPAALELSPAVPPDMAVEEIQISPGAPAAGRRVVDLGLPPGVLLVLLNRGGRYLVPRGDTALEPGDLYTVAADRSRMEEVRLLLHGATRGDGPRAVEPRPAGG